jgi:hypothetical protein
VSRAAAALAGLALVVAGLTGMARAPGTAGAGGVITRAGPITIRATALSRGPAGTLTAVLAVSTSARRSDQLDAAIAAGGVPVALYHEWISVTALSDLTDCGGIVPPPAAVDQWQHYGPLSVPGQSGAPSAPADATLTVRPAATPPAGGTLAITLYFANAGPVVLRLPVTTG